jgi:hypothetical protein
MVLIRDCKAIARVNRDLVGPSSECVLLCRYACPERVLVLYYLLETSVLVCCPLRLAVAAQNDQSCLRLLLAVFARVFRSIVLCLSANYSNQLIRIVLNLKWPLASP